MASPLVLGSVDDFVDEFPAPARADAQSLVTASPHIELTWLPNAWIVDVAVRYEPPDALVAEALVLIDEAGVELFRLGRIGVQLTRGFGNDAPLLVRIKLGSSPSLGLYDVVAAVNFDQPWLHRIDPSNGQRVAGSFSIEAGLSIVVAADGTSDLQVFGLSIPPVEIGNTGLVISLNDCQLAIEGRGIPISLRDLAQSLGETEFNGLYARRARVSWLPQFRFPSADLPGFSFNFRDVLLDDAGISFTLDEFWTVDRVPNEPYRLSPQCAMLGRLFGNRLKIALERVTGTIWQNQPVDLRLTGWLEIPAFKALLEAEFEVERDPQAEAGTIHVTLNQEDNRPAEIDLGVGQLTIEHFSVDGVLGGDSFEGHGRAGVAINLPGFEITPIDVDVAFATTGEETSFEADLANLNLGPLGAISHAEFSVALAQGNDSNTEVKSFGIEVTLEWRDLSARLGFGDLPRNLPLPPDNAAVTASVRWQADGSLELTLEADGGDPDTIFNFLPPAFRPDVREVAFGFRAVYADAADFFAARSSDTISGEVYARVSFRPAVSEALTDSGIVSVHAGDDQGFVSAEMRATVLSDGSSSIAVDLVSPIAIEFGLPGITDGSLLFVTLTEAKTSLADDDEENSCRIQLTGEFGILPAAIDVVGLLGESIGSLLGPLINLAVQGSVGAVLELQGDRAALTMSLQFQDAELEFDLFEMIGRLAAGPGASRRAAPPSDTHSNQELALDLSFQFALAEIKAEVGTLEDTPGASVPAAIELHFTAGFAGATLPIFVRLATDELVIGVEGAELPLRLPVFPLTPADLNALIGSDGRWASSLFNTVLAQFQSDIDSNMGLAGRLAAEVLGRLMAKQAMLRFIHDTWNSLSSADSRRTYQEGVTGLINILSAITGITHTDSDVRLTIGSAQLRLPFNDPQSIAVEGAATIRGFNENDPLHGLEGLILRLGLTPDQIYFGLEASGEPIPLPSVGRYVNGHVSVSQLTIGYGFTRNSLAMSFAGELVYPENLTEDANTSRLLGFGLKLPRYNRLAFRLDLIPVPGPIPLVPSLEFNIDLRTPGVPALTNTRPCRPSFDGLELDVPGVIRADIKAASLSPVFGIFPALNSRFDGDLDLGNDQFGLTLICDDMLTLQGLGTPPNQIVIPFLADPSAPYFEHLCVNVRCAGFGINFDLERPFPLPNPLLVFEVLALIADPLKPIDPNGILARCIRIALRDAYISIPGWAQPLIPGGSELLRNPINLELNLGTLISAVQWVARVVPPVVRQVQDAFGAGQAALEGLATHPPLFNSAELLAMLPAQLRAFDCQLSFAGFEGSSTIIIVTPEDARASNDAIDELWQLAALRDFNRGDLGDLPSSVGTAASVLVTANIELLNAVNYSFFGQLSENGHFALLTHTRVPPLNLKIASIKIALPLEFDSRLLLVGQVSNTRRFAEIRARGRGRWNIVPGVLKVSAGMRKPVELRLNSDGRFAVSGEGEVDFFNGAARLTGSLEGSESHLTVTGDLRLALDGSRNRPMISLDATGTAQIGPSAKWNFDGQGNIRLFDLTLADASVRLSQREIALHAQIPNRSWRIGRLRFATPLSGEFDGLLAFPKGGSPRLRLRGRGKIEALGARLSGLVTIQARENLLRVLAEGELTWLNQRWFAAQVALGSDGSAELSGRTSVALDLTPKDLPGGIQLASLFLRADFSARFGFNRNGGLIEHDIDIDWVLGLRFPGGAPNQTFVLAMQRVHTPRTGSLNFELIHVQGINFVPMSNVVLPIPVITHDGNETVIRARIKLPVISDAPGMKDLRFFMTDGIRNWLEDKFGENFVDRRHRLFTIPKNLRFDIQNHSLGELGETLGFRVSLCWRNKRLGFEIRRSQANKTFIGIDELT